MAQVPFLDHLLKEYLVYRGFSNTLKALDTELKNERDQGFRADGVMDQFVQYVQMHDLNGMLVLWQHLDTHLFNKLAYNYSVAVKKLENSLLKYYLVNAYVHHKTEKIDEFFKRLAVDLQQQSEWKDWFYLPYCRNAEDNPTFSLYFTKQWQDTFLLSLRNFLATVYQCMPQPTFVRAEQEATLIRHLQEENNSLRARLQQVLQSAAAASAATANANVSSSSFGSTASTTSAHRRAAGKSPHQQQQQFSLNDIQPFDISPPGHVVDDFCIIAAEVNNLVQSSDAQTRGLKMLIRTIGSGGSGSGSPILGRKDHSSSNVGSSEKSSKRRSGSVGRSWI